MHTLLDDYITGMGFVGIEPGALYHLAPVTQGIETTLSGTGSVVLENIVGDWVGLSIHGRSDQQTTTGAQLFDYFTILSKQITAGVVHIDADGRIILDGKFDGGNRQFRITLSPGTYKTSADAPEIWHILAPTDTLFGRTLQVDEITTYECYIASGTYDRIATTPMINQGSAALPWEPYTGNQPSPNPDYPQEIKKSGEKTAQSIPFNIGQEISSVNGYAKLVCKSDGIYVELKPGVNTTAESDMYFAGNRASNSESGYAECPEITPGRYTIASDSVNMLFYCVVWRNGTNMVNGPATASESVTFDVEAGDKFRIFLRPSATTPGNYVVHPILTQGETALPWEPYGYKIETTLDNAGYLEKGSRSDLVKKIALKKGHKYRLFSTDKNSNKNTFVFSDPDLTFTNGNALYSYGINKGYTTNNTSGIVSEECKLYTGWNPAIEFTVTEDGLYLYYGLNSSGLSDDEVWVWTGDGYLTDTPYQKQTITTYTPNGLPGIQVSSGGNYTDANGQQWVTDEIDFGRGKYVQRVAHYVFDGSEMWRADGATQEDGYTCYYYPDTNVSDAGKSMCSHAMFVYKGSVDDNWDNGKYIHAGNLAFEVRTKMTLDEWKNYLAENHVEYYAMLKTPVETDLSDEEIEAYKSLRTYNPTTIITADGGEVDPGITAKYQKGE